jgi:nucleoside-diphosphate-sugar epimerase
MPTAFVTGGTGFVGRHLVEQLVADGWAVVALHRPSSDTAALAALGVQLHEGTLHDARGLAAGIPEGCDAVFHLAANTTIWRRREAEQLRDNVDGTRNVARAALARGARRLVHASSIAAFGDQPGRIDETTPKTGRESWVPYMRSKHLGEEEVLDAISDGLDATIVNPTHILGPYDRGTWARMIRMVHDGSLPGVPSGVGAFADAREVARALRAAADRGATGENYLLAGPHASFLQVVTTIGEILDKPVPKKTTADWVLRLAGWGSDRWSRFTGTEPSITPEGVVHVLAHLDVDDSKAQQQLGYRHTDLRTLLVDTASWMRETGALS